MPGALSLDHRAERFAGGRAVFPDAPVRRPAQPVAARGSSSKASVVHHAEERAAARSCLVGPGRVLGLCSDDDPRADFPIGISGSKVAGGKLRQVLGGGDGDEGVIDGATGDPQLAQHLLVRGSLCASDKERRGEPLDEQTGGGGRIDPPAAWQPGEHGGGFSKRMA